MGEKKKQRKSCYALIQTPGTGVKSRRYASYLHYGAGRDRANDN